VRYPEYKPSDDEWVIRQTAIYHRLDRETSQNVVVLFSPTPRSKIHSTAEEWLRHHRQQVDTDPLWLHRILFATFLPAYRQYLAMLELRFLPVANSAFATYIDEPLRLGYDNLNTLTSVEGQFLQIPTILAPAADVLHELCTLHESMSESVADWGIQQLKNHQRQCVAYSRMATHLQQRVQIVTRLLSETLLLRDQVVANQQNKNMLQLNKSAVFITTLTLLYLPASFMAVSFFPFLLVGV
jgi:hypothetical protein